MPNTQEKKIYIKNIIGNASNELHNFIHTEIFQTCFLNAFAVLVKTIVYFGINKIIASIAGPSGYALIGNFQNCTQIINSLVTGTFNTGVTKYTSEYKNNPNKLFRYLGTVGISAAFTTIFFVVVILLNNQAISIALFGNTSYSVVVWSFSISLIFFVFNNLFIAILNGLSQIKLYVAANVIGSILSLIIVYTLSDLYGFIGALVALAIFQSIAFFSTFLIICFFSDLKIFKIFGVFHADELIKIVKYSSMSITTAILVPISQMIVREHISSNLSIDAAGYWEAMMRLSGGYLLLFTSVFSVYFLPKYSEIDDKRLLLREIKQGYAVVIPIAIVFFTCLYSFQDNVILLMFSSDFLPIRNIYNIFLIADFIKIIGWLIAFIMLGKGMMAMFISTEIIFSLSFVVFNILFIDLFGLQGAAIAYLVNYVVYGATIAYLINITIFKVSYN